MERHDLNKETDDAVYFYTPRFYALDNFSAYLVEIWGKVFQTAEHAYQWKKYIDTKAELAEAILKAKSPNEVKRISDNNKDSIPAEFHDKKIYIMEEILRAKADQHEKIKEVLIKTGERNIIENSPTDNFWGIGPDGNGENVLGKLWMKIRAELK